MKISTVVPSYFPAIVYGGPIFSIHSLNTELSKLDTEVYVSTSNANGDERLNVVTNKFINFGENYFVKYYNDNIIGRFSLSFIFGVWKDIQLCDLVRVEDIFSSYIPPALLYAKILNKPIVISPRGVLSKWSLEHKNKILKKIWLTFLIKPFIRFSWWHATCEAEAKDIIELYPEAKIKIIPNGINIHEFLISNKLSRLEYLKKFTKKSHSHKHVITSMGRIHEKKGFDILITSFNNLVLDGFIGVLLIAGKDDGHQALLEKKVTEYKLEDKVFFVGELFGDDKVEFLSGSDLFALPSHNENFGNVYLESLACGVPIVASTETPWSKIEKAGCGKWVENSASSTTKAIKEIFKECNDESEKLKITEASKKFATNYSWQTIAIKFRDLCLEITKSH